MFAAHVPILKSSETKWTSRKIQGNNLTLDNHALPSFTKPAFGSKVISVFPAKKLSIYRFCTKIKKTKKKT